MSSHVVIVEASCSGSGLRSISSAVSGGRDVTFISQNPGKYDAIFGPNNPVRSLPESRVITANTFCYTTLLNTLQKVHRSQRVDGIYCAYEDVMEQASEAAAHLGFRHTPVDAVRIARNKNLTRRTLSDHGIAVPHSRPVYSLKEAHQAVRTIGYPCVLKPSRGGAGDGVHLCACEAELTHAFTRAAKQAVVHGGIVLMEEFARGPLVSVESITVQGKTRFLGLTARTFGPHPYFCEMGDAFPFLADSHLEGEANRVVAASLEAIGLTEGVAHTELVLSDRGPIVIEINARLGGGFIGAMISEVYGFDYYHELISMALGDTPSIPENRLAIGAAATEIVSAAEGVLDELKSVELAKRYPGFKEFIQFKHRGDHVAPPRTSEDTVGALWCTGRDSEHAAANSRAAANAISLSVI
jgi:S-sulfo-L-cysteine synthase (3-phospho-L-serine-dependent)